MKKCLATNKKALLIYLIFTLAFSQTVFGSTMAADTTSLDAILKFMNDWMFKIGVAIALFGGYEFAISLSSNNPDGKTHALKFIAAGCIVAGIAKSPSIFGLL